MNVPLKASVAIVALLAGGMAYTQGGQAGDGERQLRRMHANPEPGHMLEHMVRRLGLDDTQRQRMENAFSAAKPEMDALRERAAANRRALAELDATDPGHDAALARLAQEKGEIATESALLHGRVKAQVEQVLTAEQRQQLEKGGKRLQKHGKRKYRRHGGR